MSESSRQFLLFGGSAYYASGGFNDFISSHDTLKDAIRAGQTTPSSEWSSETLEWWHVWDREQNRIAAKSKNQAYGAEDDMREFGADDDTIDSPAM